MIVHALLAWAEVACAVAIAPPLVGWLPAVGHRKLAACDLYALVFQYWMFLMPLLNGACAWFAAWRLHLAHGAATVPVAAVVSVLFAAPPVIAIYLFALGAAMGAEGQGDKPPRHPYRFACAMFCNWAYVSYLFSIPLALIVTVIGLLDR